MTLPPTVDPFDRGDVPQADTYNRGQPVWVWQHGHGWQPGRVETSGATAVMVRYWPAGGRGTVVDSVTPVYVTVRAEAQELDQAGPATDKVGQS